MTTNLRGGLEYILENKTVIICNLLHFEDKIKPVVMEKNHDHYLVDVNLQYI